MQNRLLTIGILSLGLATSSLAQGILGGNSRAMSLNDCIQTALEHNLSLKIERINPELARRDLTISYAGWDPAFNASYTRNHRQQPGNIDEFNRDIPGTTSDSDSFNTGLNGLLPTGLRYNVGANVSQTTGEFFGGIDPVTGLPLGFPFENANGSLFVNMTQPLLRGFLIDNTRLNIKLSKLALKQSELVLVWQIMNVVNQVETAYYDLIEAQENVKVQEKAVELAQRLLNENRKRVEVGAMAPLDEKQAESQFASARATLLQAEGALRQSQSNLKNLLSDEYTAWQDTQIAPTEQLRAVPVAFSRQDSWHKAMTLRPDLQQQRMNIERQGVIVKFNKNQVLPQLDVTGTFGYSAAGTEYGDVFRDFRGQDNPFWSVGGQISIPIGNRVARNNLRNARSQEKQTILNLKQFEQSIMVAVENAVNSAQINLQRVDATKQQREFAEAALEAEEKKLENGKSTSFFVLQLQRDLTQARSQEIQSLSQYNKAVSSLSLLEGAILQSREISLEVE